MATSSAAPPAEPTGPAPFSRLGPAETSGESASEPDGLVVSTPQDPAGRSNPDSGAPPILPEGKTYDEIKAFFVKTFKGMARRAAQDGLTVVWEFEPGFIINEPKNIVDTVKAVNEPNFKLLFDTCHGYMSAVVGSRHIEEGMTLQSGLIEFIEMCKDLIGIVHVIDSDGTLNVTDTSTHAPFGLGVIDFDQAIPALLHKANYQADWWAIDLCECPDAWEATADCKKFVDAFNEKFADKE